MKIYNMRETERGERERERVTGYCKKSFSRY